MSDWVPGYRVVAQIGVGAHSTIHRAVRITTGKPFAIKRVVNQGPDDLRFIEQVETEYKVGAAVDHPYVRHCHSIHRVKKLLQVLEVRLVMDYVEGETLQDRRPGTLNTFLGIFHRVAEGLQAMHDAGFVHADIKPNNIIVGKGVVKIIDLGQACPRGHRKERIQGTPDYIAPEQVQRLPLDQCTDVFNLGATMYWVLTATSFPTAIRQPSRRGGIDLVTQDTVQTPREINALIPLPLSQLVMDCCRENPKDRPPDMRAIMSRLLVVQSLWDKKRKDVAAQHKADLAAAKNDASPDPAILSADTVPANAPETGSPVVGSPDGNRTHE